MDFAELASLASGHFEARIIQAAVELGVFEALRGQSLAASSVAAALSTDPRATELLLDALTALSLLHKTENQYSLAEVSEKYLLTDASCSYASMIKFDAALWNCWEKLPEAVRQGKAVTAADMYQNNPGETERFIRGMDALVKARGDADVMARLFDWDHIPALLDIGSGPGTYPIHLCRLYPTLEATIFDLPGTLEITRRLVRKAGLKDRIRLIAGDYRSDPVPGSYPVILLSNIIHAESYEENERLIRKLVSNLSPEGQLLIKDHILDASRTDPRVGAIFSMLMLLTTRDGRCYSFGEIEAWLKKAGLVNIAKRDLPPPLTSSIVVGMKPSNPRENMVE